MKTLQISEDKRRFVTSAGENVYLIGDTAWGLFHRTSIEDATLYLKTRKSQGFNLVQAVILSEADGLRVPNVYGRLPLKTDADGQYSPMLPDLDGDYSYFSHVEAIIKIAEELGLYVGVLPSWGDKFNIKTGKGPEIFTPENAYAYGKWLAEILRHHDNIIWILGGDRALDEDRHYAIIDEMARGLREGDNGKFLMTFHPDQCVSSSHYLNDRSWLDFNMMQSGHNEPCTPTSYELIAKDYNMKPTRPTMDGEQCYEDHPKSFDPRRGYFDACDVRVTMYRNLFAGSAGNTYGHHSVWGFCDCPGSYFPNVWKTALNRPAACEMRYFADFISKNDLTAHVPCEDAVIGNAHDANYTAAMVGADSAYIYCPFGLPTRLNLEALGFVPAEVEMFEPTSGEYSKTNVKLEGDLISFVDRGAGRGMDAVVILRK